jgi:predicted acetyltransferase
VPELVAPTTELHASFLEALAEFRGEGRLGPGDSTGLGQDWRDGIPGLDDPAGFAAYVDRVRARALPGTPRPAGYVPDTILWFRDGATFLGRISIRHELNEVLRDVGGHIGYDVRPSARRRGHATEMLRQARPVARSLGIDPALVTCDVANIGSRKVILANGGVLEDERYGKLRFWVPTGPDR